MNYIASYGQSLALGGQGMNAISLTQRFDSLMFTGGTRPLLAYPAPAACYATAVPLVESNYPTNGELWSAYGVDDAGETILSGLTEAVKELMISQDSAGPGTYPDYRLLGSCPCHGGLNAVQLSRGTHSYARLLSEVGYAQTLATAMGLTFGVPLITWMQGEADKDTDPDDYVASVVQLISDFSADIRAATGQKKDPLFLMYQTSQDGYFPIACAQYRVAQQVAGAQIATPTYPFQVSDSPHLTPASYKTHGAYFGAAFKKLYINGEKWLPLSPKTVSCSGSTITITFNVPSAPIVADLVNVTTTNPAKAAYGFELLDADSNIIDIDHLVSITAPDTITIQSPVPVQAGFLLNYGDSKEGFGGGNIHDSQGSTYIFDGGGLNVPMHNWLTVFSYAFSAGATAAAVSLSTSLAEVIAGESLTLTAAVGHASGAVLPSGLVTFSLNGAALTTVALDSSARAAVTAPVNRPAGTYSVTAAYSGDTNYKTAQSTVLTVKVALATTSAHLAAVLEPLPAGGGAAFTATITAQSGAPAAGGSVRFSCEGIALAPVPVLNGAAVTTVSGAGIPPGSYPVVAIYSGDAGHKSSTSNTVTIHLK